MRAVSVAQAAERLGVSVPRIHQRIADGSLVAERIGSQWVIDERSLGRVQERREAGRPLSARSAWAVIAASASHPGRQARRASGNGCIVSSSLLSSLPRMRRRSVAWRCRFGRCSVTARIDGYFVLRRLTLPISRVTSAGPCWSTSGPAA